MCEAALMCETLLMWLLPQIDNDAWSLPVAGYLATWFWGLRTLMRNAVLVRNMGGV